MCFYNGKIQRKKYSIIQKHTVSTIKNQLNIYISATKNTTFALKIIYITLI